MAKHEASATGDGEGDIEVDNDPPSREDLSPGKSKFESTLKFSPWYDKEMAPEEVNRRFEEFEKPVPELDYENTRKFSNTTVNLRKRFIRLEHSFPRITVNGDEAVNLYRSLWAVISKYPEIDLGVEQKGLWDGCVIAMSKDDYIRFVKSYHEEQSQFGTGTFDSIGTESLEFFTAEQISLGKTIREEYEYPVAYDEDLSRNSFKLIPFKERSAHEIEQLIGETKISELTQRGFYDSLTHLHDD